MGVSNLIQSSVHDAMQTVALYPTYFSLVVDKSYSMSGYVNEVTKGVFDLIKQQAEIEGEDLSFSISLFDDNYQKVLDDVEPGQAETMLPKDFYRPDGGTALLDGICQSIEDMEDKLRTLPQDEERKVVIAYFTDGEEVSSRKCSADKVKTLIEERVAKGWKFIMLGTSDSTKEAVASYGFPADHVATYSSDNPQAAIQFLGKKTAEVRQGKPSTITASDRALLCENENCS